MLAERLAAAARLALVAASLGVAASGSAQSASSASFSLESSLLTGAVRATSTSYTAETCIAPGLGGVSGSASFQLTTGCGSMLTLSSVELVSLGLVAAEGPVKVPTLSEWARLVLVLLVGLAGLVAVARRGLQPVRAGLQHQVPR